LSKRVKEKKIEVDESMDCAEGICSNVKCLDDIIIASRYFKVLASPLDRTQVHVSESCVLRPSMFDTKMKGMFDFLELKYKLALVLIKTSSFVAWKKKAMVLSRSRLKSASMQIQRIFRGYITRKILSKPSNRFKGYYVPNTLVGTVQCYEIRPGVYLSTQNAANEYFSLLSKSIKAMERYSLVSVRAWMKLTMNRWKGAITQQNFELQRMTEEELYSFI
jgi:hypothetical protein